MFSNVVRQLFRYCSIPILLFLLLISHPGIAKEINKSKNLRRINTNSHSFTPPYPSRFKSLKSDSVSSDSSRIRLVSSRADSVTFISRSKSLRPSRNPYTVSQTINTHSKDITSSYHDYLKIDPAIRGKIVVRILVNQIGSVHDVQIINSSLNNKTFEQSVITQIKAWNNFSSISNNVICAYRQEFQFGE